MSLYIQDPNDPLSTYLLEALLESCEGATTGAGTFAFASTEGVRLFLKDETFKEFIADAKFDLVVGVDAITSPATLTAISGIADACPGVAATAFLSDKGRTLFHPKLCWFRKKKGGVLITGSGNLTGGGLRWNLEAFHWAKLSAKEVDEVEKKWNRFKARNTARLHLLSDPRIQEQAKLNAVRIVKAVVVAKAEKPGAAAEPVVEVQAELEAEAKIELALQVEATRPDPNDAVLIAEIPNAGIRWKQANFSKEAFTDFFGATVGAQKRIYLYRVQDDGTLANAEIRPSVSVKSRNYRFELEAAAGLSYPKSGRPIGVFVKVATRTFLYFLLMPGAAAHAIVLTYLNSLKPANAARMRREVVTVDKLRAAWSNAPLWKNMN